MLQLSRLFSASGLALALSASALIANPEQKPTNVKIDISEMAVTVFVRGCLLKYPSYAGLDIEMQKFSLFPMGSDRWGSVGNLLAVSLNSTREKCLLSAFGSSSDALIPPLMQNLNNMFPGKWEMGTQNGNPTARIETSFGVAYIVLTEKVSDYGDPLGFLMITP